MSLNLQSPTPNLVDHYVGEKGAAYFAWQGTDGLLKARFNRHLWAPHVAAHHDVLDFGCGGGYLLATLDGRRKVGVEINPVARQQARSQGIEVYATTAEVTGSFDRIISSHALEHVPHPRQAILELKEKLRDSDSRLVLLLPIDDWRTQRQYDPTDINLHLHTWTPQLAGNLLSTCGLHILSTRIISHAWPPLSKPLWRISPTLFHAAAWAWSIFRKRRQLQVVSRLEAD